MALPPKLVDLRHMSSLDPTVQVYSALRDFTKIAPFFMQVLPELFPPKLAYPLPRIPFAANG